MRIPWERTNGVQPVMRHQAPPLPGTQLQVLAWQAMVDVARVRATFGGSAATFEPQLQLLAKSHKTAWGWSLLRREDPPMDDGAERLPDLCVRTCQWNNAGAVRALPADGDRREYLSSSLPLKCWMRFLSSADISVAPLIGQTAQVLAAGVCWEPGERVEQGGELEFRFREEAQSYRFAYFPAIRTCSKLERLFADWRAWFVSSERIADRGTDDGGSVEYSESVWERWQRLV